MDGRRNNKGVIGNKGGFRRGYEWEESQLKQMRRILARDMNIVERLQNTKELSPLEEKKLQILQARVLKIMDKLHVSKTQTDITSGGEKIEKINYIIPNGDNITPNPKTTSGK